MFFLIKLVKFFCGGMLFFVCQLLKGHLLQKTTVRKYFYIAELPCTITATPSYSVVLFFHLICIVLKSRLVSECLQKKKKSPKTLNSVDCDPKIGVTEKSGYDKRLCLKRVHFSIFQENLKCNYKVLHPRQLISLFTIPFFVGASTLECLPMSFGEMNMQAPFNFLYCGRLSTSIMLCWSLTL